MNTYEFALPENYKIKRFDAYDKEWLDFIVDSRKGKQPWNGFDIIEGGVADDRVIDAVEAYMVMPTSNELCDSWFITSPIIKSAF